MFESPRQFISALGGYRAVARRLRVSATTLHGYLGEGGRLPAKWYVALTDLAIEHKVERPRQSLFSFEVLPPALEHREDAA